MLWDDIIDQSQANVLRADFVIVSVTNRLRMK